MLGAIYEADYSGFLPVVEVAATGEAHIEWVF